MDTAKTSELTQMLIFCVDLTFKCNRETINLSPYDLFLRDFILIQSKKR